MRIFKIGSDQIVDNDDTINLSIEECQEDLAQQYPEVRNATIRERTEGENQIIEFIPKPGRKG